MCDRPRRWTRVSPLGPHLHPLSSLRFVETVELQISLKNYDPQKDKRFSGTVRFGILLLPPSLRPVPPRRRPGGAAGGRSAEPLG